MDWKILLEIIAALGVIGGMFKWIWSRIDKKFESIDKRFDLVEKRFDLIEKKFDLMEKKFESVEKRFDLAFQRFDLVDQKFDKVFSILNQQGQRLSRIEGYLEGRDIRISNTGTEKHE